MKPTYEDIISTLESWGWNPGEIEEIVARLAENAAEYISSAEAEIADDLSAIEYRLGLTEAGKEVYLKWCHEHGYTPVLEPFEVERFEEYVEFCRSRGLSPLDRKPYHFLRVIDNAEESVRNTLHEWGVLDEIVEKIRAELTWLGATDEAMGTVCGGLWAWVADDGRIVVGDEGYEIAYTPSEAVRVLELLRGLPDDAGYDAVWEALPE